MCFGAERSEETLPPSCQRGHILDQEVGHMQEKQLQVGVTFGIKKKKRKKEMPQILKQPTERETGPSCHRHHRPNVEVACEFVTVVDFMLVVANK